MSSTANVSSKAPWKRSACDRCRGQKLRCHRDKNRPTDPCHRCIKSGAKCETSMARATGRPPSRRVLTTQINPPSPGNSNNNNHSSIDPGVNMMGLDYEFSLDSFLDNIGMRHSDFVMNGIEDDDDDDDLLLDAVNTASSFPSQTTNQMRMHMQNQNQPDPNSYPPLLYQFDSLPITTNAGFSSYDMELLLSKLNSELASLLFSIRSMPWDVQFILQLSLGHNLVAGVQSNGLKDGGIEGLEAVAAQSQSHPLIQVSRISTELETLLASLGTPTVQPADTTMQQFQSPSISYSCPPSSLCTPRVRTTQLLVALSCYIKIVSIYDVIFSRVSEYLIMNNPKRPFMPTPTTSYDSPTLASATMDARMMSAPTLCLGSLPVNPNPILSGILLAHLTKHQLHQIEQLLGLPEHYRISPISTTTKDGELDGLFGSQHGQSLLAAVFQHGEGDRDENQDDIRCIRSLKLRMQQMKEF